MKRVTDDGREILTGKDWTNRKREVWERDGKRCTHCFRRLRILEFDADHINLRGMSGGKRDDRLENLRILCRQCHRDRHEGKWS